MRGYGVVGSPYRESPAISRVERLLDFDSDAQLTASLLLLAAVFQISAVALRALVG